MAHASHRWRLGEPPPKIRPHSLAKHRVLEEYLKRYVETVTKNPKMEKLTITVVDGFAGGNVYTDEKTGDPRPGSPSIILDALGEAKKQAQARRRKPFGFDDYYVFIESEHDAFVFLGETLAASRHSKRIGQTIQLHRGDWVDHIDDLIALVKRRAGGERALFILDQCGYSDVPLLAVRRILRSVEKAEVFLTFATDYLITYLSETFKSNPGIVRAGIDVDRLLSQMDKTKADWRRLIQVELHGEIQAKTGAEFYTPFFIRSTDSNRDLWLIHLSGHYRARDVMMGIHWQQQNSFAHYAKPGLNMFGYDPYEEPSGASGLWLPGFYFDDTARALTLESVREELARLIINGHKQIDVQTLFGGISNGTPATVQMLREVLKGLAAEGVIKIRDEHGLKERTKGAQTDRDVIVPTGQRLLFD